MRRIVRGGAAVIAGVGIVVLGAGAASAKPSKQSAQKYAKTVCSTYDGLINDLTSYAGTVGGLDPTDPTAFQQGATAQTQALITKIKAAEKKLGNVYPDIDNGQKVGKLLATNAKELDQALTSDLQDLSTGGVAGATQFAAGIATLSTKISDPFSKVTDQDLIHAFGKEKACKNVVQVEPG